MPKIKIEFPQIIIASKEIEVTDKVFEEMKENIDFRVFSVWKNMSEFEQSQTTGKKFVYDFHNMNACEILSVENTPQ